MRSNMFRNSQFLSLIRYYGVRPRLLILAIVIFYVAVFAIFALSYVYLFSGLLKNNAATAQTMSGTVNVVTETATAPSDLTPAMSASINENIQTDTTPAPTAHAKVQINGETVSVPRGGTVHKEISTETGNASIDVNVQSQGSAGTSSSSSLNVNVNSSSDSKSEVQR